MPVLGYSTDAFGNAVSKYTTDMTLDIYGPGGSHESNCTIVDVMANSLEGGKHVQTYFPGEQSTSDFVVVNLSYLHYCLNNTRLTRIYVRLANPADYIRVMQDIRELDPASIGGVSSPYDEIQAALEARTGQAVTGTYALNLTFSFLYLTAGTFLVVTAKTRMMRRHFSLLRALGMDRNPITYSVLLDSFVNVVLGAVVGCIMGSILTLLMAGVPLSYLGSTTSVSWKDLPMTIVVPVDLLVVFTVIAFAFSLLSAFVITKRSLTSNIADDLRLRE
jgi:ABC-type antimicrobial peptide transport system permease subunit